MKMIVVFVSHQLYTRGNITQNLMDRNKIGREITEMGLVPILPHFPFLDDSKHNERGIIMLCCKSLIERCDYIVYDQNKISEGVLQELEHAKKHQIPAIEINSMREQWNSKTTK